MIFIKKFNNNIYYRKLKILLLKYNKFIIENYIDQKYKNYFLINNNF